MNRFLHLVETILTFLLGSEQKRISIKVRNKLEIEEEIAHNLSSSVENRFSHHFTLEEISKSETATRYGIDNTLSTSQVAQFRQICSSIMDPIRDHYSKAIRVISGYRCKELNKKIGGSKNSQHQALNDDAAIDFEFYDHGINLEAVFQWITQLSEIKFDQCIAEFLPEGWIHISFKTNGSNRGKITRAIKVDKKTVYKQLGYAKWSDV